MNSLESNLVIKKIPIELLKPADYNPRKWDEQAVKNLKESIQRFGLVDPILVNGSPGRKNIVIGGHFRLKIAKDIGYKEVPVVYINIPSIEKEKELNLRLNSNTGDWDFNLLRELDVKLLLDVGFDDSQLASIWDENLSLENDEFDTEAELKKIKTPKTKTGDIFQLGKHKLICQDSTSPTTLKKLLAGVEIDMIYTDPPFNLNYDYQKGLGKSQKYDCAEVNDKRSAAEYRKFLEATLQNALEHCKKDTHIFYFCDQNSIGLLQDLYSQNGVVPRRVCLWIKNNQNVTPQVAFHKCFEPCVYGIRGKPYLAPNVTNFAEILNPEIENGNRRIEDILDLLDIWLIKRLSANEYLHSTEKPVKLHERPLKRCSRVGDAILDLFGGSGSTLIACEQLKRRAFLIEKDPAFCDLIINRFRQFNPNANVKKLN
jgi:DNA modification methylase